MIVPECPRLGISTGAPVCHPPALPLCGDSPASEEGEPLDTYSPYTGFLSVRMSSGAGLSALAYPLPVPSPLHSVS